MGWRGGGKQLACRRGCAVRRHHSRAHTAPVQDLPFCSFEKWGQRLPGNSCLPTCPSHPTTPLRPKKSPYITASHPPPTLQTQQPDTTQSTMAGALTYVCLEPLSPARAGLSTRDISTRDILCPTTLGQMPPPLCGLPGALSSPHCVTAYAAVCPGGSLRTGQVGVISVLPVQGRAPTQSL